MRGPTYVLSFSLWISLLAVVLALPTGCKRTTTGTKAGVEETTKPHVPGLPQPLTLPARPPAAMHLGQPDQVLGSLAAYAQLEREALLRQLVSLGAAGFEAQLVTHVDTARPWDAAVIDGQLIVYVPVRRDGLDGVAALLEGKPAVGEFGAVDLMRTPEQPGPRLAWLDDNAAALTFAETLEGLATGRELADTYGKHPLYFTVDSSEAAKYVDQVPFARVTVTGQGLHDFELSAEGVTSDRPELAMISNGALTGMLESPQVALGASTTYAKHEETVRSILSQANREVSKQNFLVRGTLEDLLRRTGSVLRSWNGRVLAGVGPRRHLLLAFGTHNAKKADAATVHLVRGVLDNLNLARTFGISVPRVRFQKAKVTGAGTQVHVVALEQAGRFLPEQAAPLIDGRGDLRISMAFPQHAGGAMVVVGPDSSDVLQRWLEQTAGATPPNDSSGDLLAATVAVRPQTLAPALSDTSGRAALELSADAPPTKLVVRRSGQTWTVSVKGPEPAPAVAGQRVGGAAPHRAAPANVRRATATRGAR